MNKRTQTSKLKKSETQKLLHNAATMQMKITLLVKHKTQLKREKYKKTTKRSSNSERSITKS